MPLKFNRLGIVGIRISIRPDIDNHALRCLQRGTAMTRPAGHQPRWGFPPSRQEIKVKNSVLVAMRSSDCHRL